MNSIWLDIFKRRTTTIGLVAVIGLAASEALILAEPGRQDATSDGYASCGWTCLASDILWRHATTGETWLWNGIAWTFFGSLGNDWQIQGTGDFDGNGLGDILWRCIPQAPATACGGAVAGATAIWQDGTPDWTTWPGAVDFTWQIRGVGDFDANGVSDIVWRHSTGQVSIWYDANPGLSNWPGRPDNGWKIEGIGDFGGNGRDDILWRHVSGTVAIWRDGFEDDVWPPSPNNNWQIQGVGDFDANGSSDILWRCTPQAPATKCAATTAGTVAIFAFANGNYRYTIQPGALDFNWEIKGVGDFDANGSSDILWRCLPKNPATACGNAPEGSNAIWQFVLGRYAGTTWLQALVPSWKVQGVDRFDR